MLPKITSWAALLHLRLFKFNLKMPKKYFSCCSINLTKLFFSIGLIALLISCQQKRQVPDVSTIPLQLKAERFEQDFFKADTNNLAISFDSLYKKYPNFFTDYLFQILGLNPQPDSTLQQAKSFLSSTAYRQVYKDATLQYKNMNDVVDELTLGLKLTKHYFTQYQLPKKLITFVGPIDGIAVVPTNDNNIAIGLQAFLGKDYPPYQSAYVQQTYPTYKTYRFERQYIATNCIKNNINILFPNNSNGRPLCERMIEEGRRLYVLDALLPYTSDTVKTGYTANQLAECYANEKLIWSFFVQNNLLFEREPTKVTPYVSDGPKTPELSETSPGNIGTFTGWQIVKLWMKKNPSISLQQLMQTPVMKIFNEANYAP